MICITGVSNVHPKEQKVVYHTPEVLVVELEVPLGLYRKDCFVNMKRRLLGAEAFFLYFVNMAVMNEVGMAAIREQNFGL